MTVATIHPATEVAAVDYGTQLLVAEPADPTGGRIVAWALAAKSAAALGTSLAKTSFVPAAFRGKPEECAAAILYGDEIGLTPMQALQSVYVVSGRPGMYARAMVAVVLAAGHEVEPVKETPASVTVRGRRRGSDTWVESTWTTERARRAGYTSNKKYESDPIAMLYARAASDVCRRIAPDALAGVAFSVEELELSEQPRRQVSRESVATTVQRRRAVEAAPEPEAEPDFDEPAAEATTEPEAVEPEVVDEPEAPVIPPATASQLKKLGILFTEAGVTDRAERLARVSDLIGRDVASSKDLDKAEASAVINALQADVDARADEPTLDEPDFS